jgi:Ca2+-binding EF-hand superfamily protein
LIALFAQADKDGDKMLSNEEAKAIPALAERFEQVDANGDGKVSESEFMASMAPATK